VKTHPIPTANSKLTELYIAKNVVSLTYLPKLFAELNEVT